MNRGLLIIAGLCALALCVQGITEKQKLQRKRRNIGHMPDFSHSLDQLHVEQSQSQQVHFGFQSQNQGQITISCDPPCQNGICVGENECNCRNGWSGNLCDEFECANLCVHGRCVAPDTCECNSGWAGESCEEAICDAACENEGSCSAPNTCTCKNGFTGATCGTPICDKECQNGGNCIVPNTCECPKNFAGTLCQIALPGECHFPFEYNGEIYEACTITDSNDGKAWCSPTAAYQGERITCDFENICQTPGDRIEIPGDCARYLVCTEDQGIELTTCPAGQVFNAFADQCDSPHNTPHCEFSCDPVCRNDGVCIAQDTCQCKEGFIGKHCEMEEEEISGESSGQQGGNEASSGVCSFWNKDQIYTFDGVLYSAQGRCAYHLISDCDQHSFDVTISYNKTNNNRVIMTFTWASNALVLTDGEAFLNDNEIEIPSVQNGFILYRIPNTDYIALASSIGDWISWDGKDAFSFGLIKHWSGKVCGLCGNMNGDATDDLTPRNSAEPTTDLSHFIHSWTVDQTCQGEPVVDYCGYLTSEQLQEATSACKEVASGLQFDSCSVPSTVMEEVCLASLCQCVSGDFKACICEAATIYSKLCIARGANLSEWRSENFCGAKCPNNLVHSECGTVCPATCRNRHQQVLCAEQCVDGCFCPSGTVLDGETCVTPDQCSCTHLGVSFPTGSSRTERCEECVCNGGAWACEPLPCQGECSATGDPHYKTFDGLSYSFSGECQYVLATDACNGAANYTFAVVAENVKCGVESKGTCTKSATIMLRNKVGGTKYQLKHGGLVAVGGADVMLPYSHGNVHISNVSSMMILMKTDVGLEIEWDGAMRLYVRVDSDWQDRVCGMCGNYNSRSFDDMKNPQNMIETNPANFGNSWKVNTECPDVDSDWEPILPEACLTSHDKLVLAEEACGVLKSEVFQPCHVFVDYGNYYYECRDDVCSCGEGLECSCEVLADYARACSQNGATINWRNQTNCEVTCPEGMVFEECGGYCGRTCKSIGNVQEVCETSCTPGCVCNEGLYLTEHNTCVEVQDCGCYYDGEMYEPGATVSMDTMICTCANGVMSCEVKQEVETCKEPEKYVDCASLPKGSNGVACLATCQDPKLFCSTEHCLSGCACPEGTIKDEALNKCVKPEHCSCLYDGKVHHHGDEISQDGCNTCTCNGGNWYCTEMACAAECSSVGDPHFSTFDGRTYDFQGDCSYVMAEDFCGNGTTGSFRVIIETIPCGDNDVTCTKAVTFHLYNYEIHLTKGDGEPIVSEKILTSPDVPEAPVHLQYTVRRGSIYYIVETNVGINILWNAENAVKVQLYPQFMHQVCGLCGNYDGDMSNDFQMRAGDVAADPNMFGNDWKVMDSCPDASGEPHPCQVNPTIAPWAEKKCNIINSDVFKDCHAKVAPGKFYENCLYDTCGCNAGGDCQCFCTSVAAYAQACAAADICVNWRSNDVCPVMCEAYNPGFGSGSDEECEWRYEPCGNPCPPTCSDRNPADCPWKHLEGCYVTCKEDEVWDDENGKCMKESECPPIPTTPEPPAEPVTTTTPKPPPTTTTIPPTTTTTEAWCECVDSNGIAHAPGETWPLRGDESLCVDLTCVEEAPGVCRTESFDKTVLCTEENRPVCQNGYWPVSVQDGCSCHWECQCYCFGQGDPHFFTFDGYYYPFQGNCTFVLSRDMNAHRSNHPHEYEVWMDNEVCADAPETTCTRKMTIRYHSTHVALFKNYTYTINGGPLQHRDTLPRDINGIVVAMRGSSLFHVTIPDISLELTYTGVDYSWSLSVPYSRYHNKTEGLCGVCNNDQSDDFTNREGEIVTEIEDFGNSWLVFNESRRCFKEDDVCKQPPSEHCELILSNIFEGCHHVVDPEVFYQICLFDTSRCGNYSYCEALYGYARACDHEGVCVDWRSDNVCPIECSSDRVYEACKPNCEQQCSNFVEGIPCGAEEIVEGCFCPPDTVELNGECVHTSTCTNCVDVDGTVYQYGESWVPMDETCSICSCMENQNILCSTKTCPSGTNVLPDCSACFVPEMIRGSDPCCPEYHCVCNYLVDAGEDGCHAVGVPACEVGYIPVLTNPDQCVPDYECQCNTTKSPCPSPPVCGELEHVVTHEGECCPIHTCECLKCVNDNVTCGDCQNKETWFDYCGCAHHRCEDRGVCRFNGTDKLPGEKWHPNVCETCTCHNTTRNSEGCYESECFAQTCSTSCPPCSEYRPVTGQCCGTCVKVGCEVFQANHTASECKSIGDMWYDYGECNQFTCAADADGNVGIITDDVTCPVVDIITCPTCYRLSTYTDQCCPKYHCVPDDVCCLEGPSIKVPGETWSPNSCTNCQCTPKKNHTSGFHQVMCEHVPCPSFDEETCAEIGGQAVPTNDGCCMKCDNKCIDNNNNTHFVGEYWYVDNCTICSCVEGNEIVCNPKTCPEGIDTSIPNCGKCEVVARRAASDPCCPQYDCVCNYLFAQGEPDCDAVPVPKCPPGYVPEQTNVGECIPEYDCICNMSRSPCIEAPTCNEPLEHLVTTETECCPIQTCECRACEDDFTSCSQCEETIVTYDPCGCRHITCKPRNVCLVNGNLHLVNETWHPDVCSTCHCTEDFDKDTSCHYPICFAQDCDVRCPTCHEYVPVAGQCCGTCIQTGCPVPDIHGQLQCASPGQSWSFVRNCSEYTCTENTEDGGYHVIEVEGFTCPIVDVPACPPCHLIESYVEDCCPKFRCTPQELCCENDIGKLPGSHWSPNSCETCYCTEEKNHTSGFYIEQCFHNPCPPVDEEACFQNGGILTTTDNGCCSKCEIAECYECGRRVSTSPEYMVVDECASTEPVSISYCDGYCRGSYFWSEAHGNSQCSCCNPTSTASHSVTMKCKNGTEVVYQFEDVLSCGCTATCTPQPPTVTPSPEAPVTTTTIPIKTTPTTTEESEESGSGSGWYPTIPDVPIVSTITPEKETPTTTTTTTTEEPEESGSGEEVTVTIPEAPITTTTTPVKTTSTTTTTTTEEPEESGSGSGEEVTVTIPEAPITTTTTPVKTTPTTTTEEPEESGSGSGEEVTVTIPEAPVTTTTTPVKTTPTTTTTTTTTTTEEPEESGSGSGEEVTVTIPEAPVTTTTTPVKTTPTTTTTTTTTTTAEPEESGSGSGEEVTVTIPEAPVTTTTTPEKTTPTTTTATTTTTTEEPEESGSGDVVTVTIPEAPTTTTTTPEKTTPTTTTTSTTTTSTTTEEPEESGSGSGDVVTVTIPEAPTITTTTTEKTTPTTTTPTTSTTTTTPTTTTTTTAPTTTTTTTTPTTTTTTTTPTTTTTTTTVPTTTTTEATTTIPCYWSDWISSDTSKLPDRDDNETFAHIRLSGHEICEKPQDIECRPVGQTVEDFVEYQQWQVVSCDVNEGLLCLGSRQTVHPICEDYEIRVYCCPSSHSPGHGDVSLVQSQVQHIITNLENGHAPSESELHNAFINMQHHENAINSELQTLIEEVNSRNEHHQSVSSQEQHQIQHHIQTLDQQLAQQSQMQHAAEAVVQQGVSHMHDTEAVASQQAYEVLQNNVEHNVQQSQNIHTELQDSIHKLIQSQEFSHNIELEPIMHDLQNLEHSQSDLMHQEQAQQAALQSLQSSESHEGLDNAFGVHMQQSQHIITGKRSNDLESEVENLE